MQQYRLPPNPLKDHSNAAQYRADHGEESWELDALDADVLAEIVTSEIENYVCPDVQAECSEREQAVRDGFAARMGSLIV